MQEAIQIANQMQETNLIAEQKVTLLLEVVKIKKDILDSKNIFLIE